MVLTCALVAWGLAAGDAAATASSHPTTDSPPKAAAKAGPSTAKELLDKLATVPALEAQFREEKKLALLRAPLVSEGRLYFLRPGYLLRRVEHPQPSSVRITPTGLLITDASGERQVDLRSRPDVKLFVESFTRVLAGDRTALERIYVIEFRPATKADPNWQLTLKPKGPPLSRLVRSVAMSGRGFSVHSIQVVEASGDSSVTQLSNVNAKRRFSEEEQRQLFGIQPKKD